MTLEHAGDELRLAQPPIGEAGVVRRIDEAGVRPRLRKLAESTVSPPTPELNTRMVGRGLMRGGA